MCRLYSSAHFNDSFPQHTDPEVLKTPLEGVALIMKAMGIDKVWAELGRTRASAPQTKMLTSTSKRNPLPALELQEHTCLKESVGDALYLQVLNFPFPTPPDVDALAAAEGALRALGALGADGALTERGRAMARLPLDPRPSRMILQVSLVLMPSKWPHRCLFSSSHA